MGMILSDYLTKKSSPGTLNTKWDETSADIAIHLLFSANRWEKRLFYTFYLFI